MRRPKTFTVVTTTGDPPTRHESLALFDRAAEVIELRVQTPCGSIEALEEYARSMAREGDLTLIATRRADWHKPFLGRTNRHEFLSLKWRLWSQQQRKARAEYPQIKIANIAIIQSIENAENQLWLAQYGRYGKPNGRRRVAQPKVQRPLHERLVDQRSVLWMARELPGVAEITLLPDSGLSQREMYPITVTLATAEGLEDVCRAIRLLGEGKRPYESALQTLVDAGKERGLSEQEVMQAHETRQVKPYKKLWEEVCKARKYGDPRVPIIPCVCEIGKKPPPKTLGEAARQLAERVMTPEVHEPECYERFIDVWTYWPDWWLAHNRMTDKICERHTLIAYYNKKLAQARKQKGVEPSSEV